MKKILTLATIFAASSALNGATTITLLPSFSSTSDFGWLSGSNILCNSFASPSITEENVQTWLTSSAYGTQLQTTGWHAGVANGQQTSSSNELSGVTQDSGFTFTGRKAYGGEYVTATVKLSEKLSENDVLNSLSISFDVGRTNDFSFSVYSWDGTTAKRIGNVITGQSSVSFSETGLSLDYSKTIFVVFNANSAGNTYAISNLTSSATYAPIPEPSAFGLLAGVGAIALAVSRRRRVR